MPLVTDQSLVEKYVRGKDVAIICNAPEILDQDYGKEIDQHDIVLRMNRAVPAEQQFQAIGSKTDILTGGMIEPIETLPLPRTLPWLWWFKHTQLGASHLESAIRKLHYSTMIWHMPFAMQRPLASMFGREPSSGPNAVHCCTTFGARSITIYGLSCWGEMGQDEPGGGVTSRTHWWEYSDAFKWLSGLKLPHSAVDEAKYFRSITKRTGKLRYEVKR